MARRQAANGESFRAVITKTYPDGTVETDIYGPYGTVGAARAMRTNRVNYAHYYGRRGVSATGEVHRAVAAWELVPDEPTDTEGAAA